MTLAAFIGVALAHLLAAISPGPSFVLSIRTAATEGFRPAAGLAIGFGIGAAIWAFAALAGLALLFQIVPPLFVAMKLAGGLFLLWLGLGMWRRADTPMPKLASGADQAVILFNILWVETMWYVLVARAFSLERARAAYGRAKAWTDRAMGTILGALGLKVALD